MNLVSFCIKLHSPGHLIGVVSGLMTSIVLYTWKGFIKLEAHQSCQYFMQILVYGTTQKSKLNTSAFKVVVVAPGRVSLSVYFALLQKI